MADDNKWKPPGDDEEEEEEIDETAYKNTKDAVLFAIEVSPSMLEISQATDSKKGERDSPTTAALKCAYALMQQRIISHPNDMIGVLLYGTKETKFQDEESSRGSLSYPHCYLLNDLNIPSADDVRALRSMVQDEEENRKLLVASPERVSMANVLFCANQIFTTKAPNFGSRRLFIVTDDDDPHKDDPALKSSAAVRAKDLYDLGCIIELFPISKPGHGFDRTKFYNDIIYNALPTDPEAPAPLASARSPSDTKDGLSLLQSLLSSVNSKAVARRALFSSVPFEISPSLKISVKGYLFFKRQAPTRSCYIWLEGEKPQIATGTSTQLADDTARVVDKVEIKKAYKFGGEQIIFTPEEVTKLRTFGDPVIRIIGFKPISMLPFWANCRPSTFLYPSEDDFVGSTRVFSALHQKLLKSKKMGVTWFVPRRNATPVIAALIPGPEKLDDNGDQVMPPGLWLIPLPFADDIRQEPDTTHAVASDSLINSMRPIIEQLQLPKGQYDPSKYPNPSLQWHYRILQAMALEEDVPTKAEDKTLPKYRQIEKRIHEEAAEWRGQLEAQRLANRPKLGDDNDGKRKAPSGGWEMSDSVKKPKSGSVDPSTGPTDEEMGQAFGRNSIGKLKVVELSTWLKSKGLITTGHKAALVERVEQYFEKK